MERKWYATKGVVGANCGNIQKNGQRWRIKTEEKNSGKRLADAKGLCSTITYTNINLVDRWFTSLELLTLKGIGLCSRPVILR